MTKTVVLEWSLSLFLYLSRPRERGKDWGLRGYQGVLGEAGFYQHFKSLLISRVSGPMSERFILTFLVGVGIRMGKRVGAEAKGADTGAKSFLLPGVRGGSILYLTGVEPCQI